MRYMRHLDLFSGIGAWALASQAVWPERKMVGFVEIEQFPQSILRKHFPSTPIYEDIKDFDGSRFRGIELLTGSPPCQAASQAGQQRGEEDSRWLWPDTLRVLGEVRPKWFIFENVYGLLSLKGGVPFEQVCSGMEEQGYEVWPIVLPVAGIGGNHQRKRVWLVGHANGNGEHAVSEHDEVAWKQGVDETIPDPERHGFQGRQVEEAAGSTSTGEKQLARFLFTGSRSPVPVARAYRKRHGVPSRLDVARNKALGNAIVPQVAVEIMRAIHQHPHLLTPKE